MEQSCRKKNKENKIPKTKSSQNDVVKKKVSEFLGKAEGFMEALNFEEAGKACEKALKLDPNNCEALEMRSATAIETGEYEVALTCLDKAISIAPFSGYRKYLSRAQLSTGEESLHFYNKGIEIIKVEMSKYSAKTDTSISAEGDMEVDGEKSESSKPKTEEESKLQDLALELSSIFCSISELYMTDLCDEDDAEEFCKAAILNGIESDSTNPEPYVMKVSSLIVINIM